MEVDEVKRRLEVERTDARARLADLTRDFDGVVIASKDTNADDEHDPEGATIAYERSRIGSLIRRTELLLEEIDAAEARVSAGTYGICERCGDEIGEDRLDARPYARTCLRCF